MLLSFSIFAICWGAIQQPVVSIEVKGNLRVPAETIMVYVGSLRGKASSPEEFRDAFRRLWDTGFFEDIHFITEDVPGGVRLIVEVEEKPLLGSVRIRGENLTEADLVKELRERGVDLRPGRLFSKTDAEKAATVLASLLGDSFRVSAEFEPVEGHRVDLVLGVSRRVAARIASIEFQGNRALDDVALRGAMRLRPSDWKSWLTRRNRLRSEELDADLEGIRSLYRSQGYLRVNVGPATIEEIETGRLSITIPIDEGEPHELGKVSVAPGHLLTEEILLEWIPLSAGEVYDGTAIDRVVRRLEEYYRERGYALVRVDRDEQVEARTRLVHLRLDVTGGPMYRVGRIEFSGNSRYRDQDLRQCLDLAEGEIFTTRGLETSTRALIQMGSFRSVRPEVHLVSALQAAEIAFHLEEIPRFEYLIGGNANPAQGATGSGQFVVRSLFGRGETFRAEVDLGNRFQNFAVGYLDPFTLGRAFSLAVDFTRFSLKFPDETSEDSYDLRVRATGPANRRLQHRFGLAFSQFTLDSDLDEFVPFLTPFVGERFRTHRLEWSLGFDGRDAPVLATRGTSAQIRTELVGGFLGGGVELFGAGGQINHVMSLDRGRRHLIGLSGRARAVWPFGATEAEGLPRFERLFLGGENDMRGFSVRGVGPRTEDAVVGGERLLFGSAEYQYVAHPRFRLVGFFDVGNVYASDFEGVEQPLLRFDAGGEVQIRIPVWNVPFRFGYGFNLDPLLNESTGQFYLSFSVRF
ncbi:MAG: outer membrane protein assembly factor BamA [Vicinamibacteria bacterium]